MTFGNTLMVSMSDDTGEYWPLSQPFIVTAASSVAKANVILWVRSDDGSQVLSLEGATQLASLLSPFGYAVASHRPPGLHPAAYVTTEVCALDWRQGIGGTAPATILRPSLVGRNPAVPHVNYVVLPSVHTLAHEEGHRLGMHHRAEARYVMTSGKGLLSGFRWHADELALGRHTAAWYRHYCFGKHQFSGGWNFPPFVPPADWTQILGPAVPKPDTIWPIAVAASLTANVPYECGWGE